MLKSSKKQPFPSLCRNPGEDTKMLVCDMCDKGYHTFCLQPAIDSLPTNGWRCKVGKPGQLGHLAPFWSKLFKVCATKLPAPYLQWLLLAASDFLVVGDSKKKKHNQDLWIQIGADQTVQMKGEFQNPILSLWHLQSYREMWGRVCVHVCALDLLPCSGLCFSCF